MITLLRALYEKVHEVLAKPGYLTNEERISGLKCHKLVEVEKNVEEVSGQFAMLQITECKLPLFLQHNHI